MSKEYIDPRDTDYCDFGSIEREPSYDMCPTSAADLFRCPNNPIRKTYYRPIEAAIRWAGLHEFEGFIMGAVDRGYAAPAREDFPDHAHLFLYLDRIFDAIAHNEIPYGRAGEPVSAGVFVPKDRVTVRHKDLKIWLEKTDPQCRPLFLYGDGGEFDEVTITLQELNDLKSKIINSKDLIEKQKEEISQLEMKLTEQYKNIDEYVKENLDLKKTLNSIEVVGKAATTYNNIIGALLEFIEGKMPKVLKHPSFKNESQLILLLDSNFKGLPGLSESCLSRKFPSAKRSLDEYNLRR